MLNSRRSLLHKCSLDIQLEISTYPDKLVWEFDRTAKADAITAYANSFFMLMDLN
jgi:hypothetical protein